MHLSRKLFHTLGVLIVVAYVWPPLERVVAATLLVSAAVLLGLFDIVRARVPAVQAFFQKSFRILLDPKDETGAGSFTFYFGGCALAIVLFPRDYACAGILALTLGDPFAAVIGTAVRSPSWNRVSVAGSLACFVFATAGCRVFFPWGPALIGGATATVLEAFSGSKADNFTMPVGTALVLWLL